ncbi:MAG: tRNA (N6-threonylcarbamoyladenosine(37)-N6)-methyltransferase TrmO [Theionarchaea archaeon]|nr:tRNA (N6-threonylcarbamoyladenosine(37)-N6)-methyltransferase TrmO [Theionarchaea archaeon]
MGGDVLILIPIGSIRTPFDDIEGMPIQPGGAADILGRVEVKPEYMEGLKDLEGFSHIILIYQFHRSRGFSLQVHPFLDDEARGVFSTRAPRRPNPIGFSVVELTRVDGWILHVRGIDVLDGTPLLDIKPYVPDFDTPRATRIGWLEGKTGKSRETRADDRFM